MSAGTSVVVADDAVAHVEAFVYAANRFTIAVDTLDLPADDFVDKETSTKTLADDPVIVGNASDVMGNGLENLAKAFDWLAKGFATMKKGFGGMDEYLKKVKIKASKLLKSVHGERKSNYCTKISHFIKKM